MDKEKDEVTFNVNGNPGQGNTFINLKIEKAINVNPNATKVENTFIMDSNGEIASAALKEAGVDYPTGKPAGKRLSAMTIREMLEEGIIDKAPLQKEIMKYVAAIRTYVKEDKDKLFLDLWKRIIEHRAFAIELYDPGKQDFKFNRNLAGRIMHYLDGKGFYKEAYNQSEMTRAVALKFYGTDNKGADDPIRKGLGEFLEEKFSKVVDELINELT